MAQKWMKYLNISEELNNQLEEKCIKKKAEEIFRYIPIQNGTIL